MKLLTVVTMLVVSAVPAAASTPDRPCPAPVATQAALHELTAAHGIVGAAVELSGPRCGPFTRTSGVADTRTAQPMAPSGHIRIGSTTKTFTATVVLQLAAERKLGLDTAIERYLPGVVPDAGITVRDLLRHTSGLPDHVDALEWESFPAWRYRTFTPAELVGLALAQPRPGPGWHYSSTNYVLLGMLVERVTGRTVGSEITRRIVRPLGLRDTVWPGNSPLLPEPHPRAYYQGADITELNVSWGGAAGALVSSLADENRFFAALLGGRLLPGPYLRQMMTTVAADPDRLWPGARYGLGLIATPMHRCGITTFWGHSGTTPGFETVGGSTSDGRRAQLVITSNTDSQASWEALHTTLEVALCDAR